MSLEQDKAYKTLYLKTALVVIPLLAMLSTSPIFIVSGNDLRLMPRIWLGALFPMTAIWFINYKLYEKFGKGRKSIILSFVIVFIFITITRYSFLTYFRPWHGTQIKKIPPYIVMVLVGIVNNSMILIVHALIRLSHEHVQMAREVAALKYQNMNARYQNLKNQLHPHFLFNALSTLKILIKKNPQEAEAYVLKLSDFLRSSIEANKKAVNTLEEDLQIALNYLEIQKVRFAESIFLEHRLSEAYIQGKYVPILCIQTLFENILKHNIASKSIPLRISISQNDDGSMSVKNNLQAKSLSHINSSGTGLDNLTERFVMLGGPEIIVSKNDTEFMVTFTPFANEHSDH